MSNSKEKARERQQRYRERHREEINRKSKERQKKYREDNPDEARRKGRERHWKNVEKSRQYLREQYHKNPQKHQEYTKKHNRNLRKKVIEGYGSKCACCGENQYEFLALDHVNGGGNKLRLQGTHTYVVYRDALKRNFPSDYQILCHNCNNAKGFYGYCPHNLSN